MLNALVKYREILYLITIIILVLVSVGQCNVNRIEDGRISEILNYVHEVKTYETEEGIIVEYNEVIGVTPQDLALVQDSILNFIKSLDLKPKDVYNSTVITERLILDTLEIPLPANDCSFDTTLTLINPFYHGNFTLSDKFFRINSLEFPNRQTIILTRKREKWFKPKKSIVTVTNSNLLIQTDGISSYEFLDHEGIFQKRWVQVAGGAIVGIATYKIITKK